MIISITQKLKFYESVFGGGRLAANGKNFGVRCPICAPTDANKRKLIIRVEDDVNHCWTCGFKAHTLAPLLKKYGSNDQLRKYRDEFMPDAAKKSTWFNHIDNEVEEKKALELPKDFVLLNNASTKLPDVKACWLYLKSRNITVNDAWYFKLGISNEPRWKGRIIIPSFDSLGELNYFVGRSVWENDRRQKYDNPDDDKLQIVFNELNIDWSKRVVICEGPFDLMKCGENAIPLLGSDLNEQSRLFSQIIVNNADVSLALDSDMWETKAPKIAKKLQNYNVDVELIDIRPWDDPGKMTKQQFHEALGKGIVPSWTSDILNKLNMATKITMSILLNQY